MVDGIGSGLTDDLGAWAAEANATNTVANNTDAVVAAHGGQGDSIVGGSAPTDVQGLGQHIASSQYIANQNPVLRTPDTEKMQGFWEKFQAMLKKLAEKIIDIQVAGQSPDTQVNEGETLLNGFFNRTELFAIWSVLQEMPTDDPEAMKEFAANHPGYQALRSMSRQEITAYAEDVASGLSYLHNQLVDETKKIVGEVASQQKN